MLISAKLTKLSYFANTFCNFVLILDKTSHLMSLTTFHRQFANHLQGVRAFMTFLPCFILMWSFWRRRSRTFQHWTINGL